MEVKAEGVKKKVIYDLPDIQQFLNVSRILVRQIEILSNVEIPEEYKEITRKAAEMVAIKAAEWSRSND